MKKLFQTFHLVTLSPWPLNLSFSVYVFMMGVLNWFNNYSMNLLFFGNLLMLICMIQWWRDVIRESAYQGFHTNKVVKGLKLSMLLFILSEIMYFFSIFWCYFHMFLSPSIEIGSNWPPKNILMFNPYNNPLLNTVILLSSGVSVTWCHYSLLNKSKIQSIVSLMITIVLGIIFTWFQYMEYKEAAICISDSIYGSIFFLYQQDFMDFMY